LYNGDKVVNHVKSKAPDLVILDIMLPGMDGMTICREIRAFSNLPIIMMTARVEEVDRLVGFELGADDYICKPFSPRELVARVKAVLKRTTTETGSLYKNLVQGPITVNESSRQVTVNGKEIRLTPNEYGLLMAMIRNPGHVFSRNELLNLVQGYQYEGYDRTIDSHIKNLRKKMNRALPDMEFISSIYGVGYRLNTSGS
jgi:two-component system response regulator BaeR